MSTIIPSFLRRFNFLSHCAYEIHHNIPRLHFWKIWVFCFRAGSWNAFLTRILPKEFWPCNVLAREIIFLTHSFTTDHCLLASTLFLCSMHFTHSVFPGKILFWMKFPRCFNTSSFSSFVQILCDFLFLRAPAGPCYETQRSKKQLLTSYQNVFTEGL